MKQKILSAADPEQPFHDLIQAGGRTVMNGGDPYEDDLEADSEPGTNLEAQRPS